jgi:glycine hydroxymethyltransferase
MNTEDMDQIAETIAMMIKEGEAASEKAKAIVKSLTEKYPLR